MSEATFTFRVDEALKNDFAAAAKARDRTSAQLLRDFMREFVQQQEDAAEHDAWWRRQVRIGVESANAGSLMPVAGLNLETAVDRWRSSPKPCGCWCSWLRWRSPNR